MKKLTLFTILLVTTLVQAKERVNPALNPKDFDDEVPSILRDMGVVQQKEFNKKQRFLMSNYMTLEFADGPITVYGVNLNPGFAFSEFFEVYLNVVPFFIIQERSIVDEVAKLELSNGKKASISAAKPKYQIGFEALYAFGYGKESLGLANTLRSDTFIKAGVARVYYPSKAGWRVTGALGKSFFLANWFSLRLSVGATYLQSFIELSDAAGPRTAADSGTFAFIESGFVFYF